MAKVPDYGPAPSAPTMEPPKPEFLMMAAAVMHAQGELEPLQSHHEELLMLHYEIKPKAEEPLQNYNKKMKRIRTIDEIVREGSDPHGKGFSYEDSE